MNGNPPQGIAETDRGRSSRRMLILVVLVILGVVVSALGFREHWVISAVCPKCLQGASITMVKVARMPIFKRTTYSQHVHLSPSWSGRTASVSEGIDPRMYTEILAKECRHEFKRDWFGATTVSFFICGVHKDGGFSERRLYQPRIEAVAALYSVFANVPNKPLARMTYARIDSIVPMSKEGRLQEVHAIRRWRESGGVSDQELQQYYPESFPMSRAIEELELFAARLSNAESEEEWAGLLHDLDGRLEVEGKTQ